MYVVLLLDTFQQKASRTYVVSIIVDYQPGVGLGICVAMRYDLRRGCLPGLKYTLKPYLPIYYDRLWC
jgi:hypothetical protein